MGRTLEERVERLEAVARRTPAWAQYHYIDWQKTRVEELRATGMSVRQAKNQAWREAQKMDFSKIK
ncbi:hypothetical protein [Cronobacter phage JC01]|uniref:Uncharacterized protein n=1 Tax=Cronobacter phage JC01 TaxID=2729575 RepID=A0A6M3YKL7_9CAUD|nr:hypothetical protein JT331_gp44 [Cronobacter phage JC01]QJI52271.1 hypothetical protein [Cronobacter phage JC01]